MRTSGKEESPGTIPLEGTVTRLEVQRKNHGRISIYLDGEFALGVHTDLILKFSLTKGTYLSEQNVAALREADEQVRAREAAVSLLAATPRSRSDLGKRLRRKGFSETACEVALERMAELGYLDDSAYARLFAMSRSRSKGYGPARVRLELLRRGVSDADIESAITAAFEAVDLAGTATGVARQRWERLKQSEADPRKRRKKLYDFLLRRGYNFDTIDAVWRRLS
jgi:regulatory protein